jgi:hypothetical protein
VVIHWCFIACCSHAYLNNQVWVRVVYLSRKMRKCHDNLSRQLIRISLNFFVRNVHLIFCFGRSCFPRWRIKRHALYVNCLLNEHTFTIPINHESGNRVFIFLFLKPLTPRSWLSTAGRHVCTLAGLWRSGSTLRCGHVVSGDRSVADKLAANGARRMHACGVVEVRVNCCVWSSCFRRPERSG